MTDHPNLFDLTDKTYHRIGEVAEVVGVKPYVLRYWESEFTSLTPQKSGQSKHRLYTKEDIDLLLTIKNLLYDEMYTVAGARRQLAAIQKNGGVAASRVEAADDPLQGTERVAMEQELEEMRARVEQVQAERDEALALATQTSDAIAEVEVARSEAESLAQRLSDEMAAAASIHAEAIASLENALASERERVEELELQRANLLEAAWPEEDAQGRLPVTVAPEVERDLRNKLAYQATSRRRVLKSLRAEVVGLLEIVQPYEPEVATVTTPGHQEQALT